MGYNIAVQFIQLCGALLHIDNDKVLDGFGQVRNGEQNIDLRFDCSQSPADGRISGLILTSPTICARDETYDVEHVLQKGN